MPRVGFVETQEAAIGILRTETDGGYQTNLHLTESDCEGLSTLYNWALTLDEKGDFSSAVPLYLHELDHAVYPTAEQRLERMKQLSERMRKLGMLQEVHRGRAARDGLTELLVRRMTGRERPTHFAGPGGLQATRRYGRFEEEIQTAWCKELTSTPWTSCCMELTSTCWPPSFQQHCCFPSQAFCARWVGSGSFTQLVRLASRELGDFPQQTHEFNLLDWCAPSEFIREQKAKQLCEHQDSDSEKMQLICRMRLESRQLLPSMAPRSQAAFHLWKDLRRPRT
ncbi:unnamed protein product [Durusdinium trenchii]|uniref:Uncharacterized protein n=1 Tax=Durusdinium trenchii TaxID=1381693 RepID=A0ABP0QHG3_9DINO